MYIYLTNGTYEYLTRIKQKYPGETMVTMKNEADESDALLLHESNGESVFKTPRKYEILDSSGNLGDLGFVVMNHIPVTDEGSPLFEYRFKNRSKQVENRPGFLAIRVLRPLASNTYIIMTIWKNETAFEDWKNSASFKGAHHSNGGEKEAGSQPQIFAGAAYVKKYFISDKS